MQPNLESLPDELLLEQALLLPAKDIFVLCKTNRRFRDVLCNDPYLWGKLWRRDISTFVLPNSEDVKIDYIDAFARLPKSKSRRNAYAAANGLEKLLTFPINMNEVNEIMTIAARNGQRHIIDLALKMGANNFDETMEDAASEGYIDIVDDMLRRGATNYEDTLVAAAVEGHMNIVDKMLKLGIGNLGHAIYLSAVEGQEEVVERLLRELPLYSIEEYNELLFAAVVSDNLKLFNRAIQLGADNYNHALTIAVKRGRYDMAARLLNLGANNYEEALEILDYFNKYPKISALIKQWQQTNNA